MIVFTDNNNPNTFKIIIISKFNKQVFTLKIVSPNEKFDRLPFLKLPCGTELNGLLAAISYLTPDVNSEITSDNIFINKWLEWDSAVLQPALIAYASAAGGALSVEKSKILSLVESLNNELKTKKYLINDNLTTADLSIWASLWCTVAVSELAKEITAGFGHVDRWMKEIEQLQVVQESLNEYKIERGPKCVSSITNSGSWIPVKSQQSTASGKSSKIMAGGDETGVVSATLKDKEAEAVSTEEIEFIKKHWNSTTPVSMADQPHTILPKKGERNILITSALPYVNNVPHLGNIIGCVLSGDIFARYCRQRHYNTLYICGTDEYGTATEAKAFQEKLTPQQICDKYFNIHNDIYRWFNIGFDYFGRTTTPEQTKIVQDFFLRIKSEGYILTESIDQLFCKNCEKFLADRFVEGGCPGCKYPDARGDQCDGCGHLVNATELINPRCKICNQTPIVRASTQFFLDLPKIEPKLRTWAAESKNGWSSVARSVAKPWLRDGLKPRCITRDLKWGIPVPIDKYRDKVFYVWFDAPLGYISITKKYTNEYEKWWRPAKDVNVSLYQFMAKDNVPFHAVMFPATILAADQGYTLVQHIMATEYLNYEDTKFSKSRGTGVFGNDARETGIPADLWRFYLAYVRPETQDSNFNWIDLATKINTELLNNFGNFINRALSFAEKNFKGCVPEINLREDELNLLALIQRDLTSYNASMEESKMRDALRHMLSISKHGNQYMQSQQPWVQIKGSNSDKQNAQTVIGICSNIACLLSSLMGPFMPSISRTLRSQLGLDTSLYGYIPEKVTLLLPARHKLGKPLPLFTKIEDKRVEELREKYGGKQDNNDVANEPAKFENVASDIPSLEAAIAKQGNVVRELKKKEPKSVWQPQVEVLLKLKQKLTELTETTKK